LRPEANKMQEEDPEKFPKREINDYTKYTGIAFQMMAIIGIFTFIGYKLDNWLRLNYPVFTIIFILLSVFTAIYSIIRSLK
jgi:F0F1-type ATP synthase assembly protein I